MVKYFELNRPYNFESGDLTALIYVICTTLGVMGYNIIPLFLLGSIIGTVTCWRAHRINLIVLNVSLLILNFVSFIKMF